MNEPQFTIPGNRIFDFLISAISDLNAKVLVLSEISMQFYSQRFQKNEQETKKYFDELLRQASIGTQSLYFSKYGDSGQKESHE